MHYTIIIKVSCHIPYTAHILVVPLSIIMFSFYFCEGFQTKDKKDMRILKLFILSNVTRANCVFFIILMISNFKFKSFFFTWTPKCLIIDFIVYRQSRILIVEMNWNSLFFKTRHMVMQDARETRRITQTKWKFLR